MVNMVAVDDLDRRLVHALQLDGQASFSRIAAVLGVSARVLSRRYLRLRSRLTLRVIGTTDAARLDQLEWFVQVRTSARSVDALVATLAARNDTSWVSVLAGGTHVTCILRTMAIGGMAAPVLAQLAQSAQVLGITTQCLLAPVAGVGGWLGRLDALTPDQHTALAPGPAVRTVPAPGLTSEDTAILRELAKDARVTVTNLARTTTIPESTVRRRISELRARGVLRFEIDIDPRLYGRPVEAICWLDVPPHGLTAVTQALAGHPQVAFAATTTGSSSVIAILELADARELHEYLTVQLGSLPAVRHIRTELVDRRIKRAGPLLARS